MADPDFDIEDYCDKILDAFVNLPKQKIEKDGIETPNAEHTRAMSGRQNHQGHPEAAAAFEERRDVTVHQSENFEGLAGTDLKKLKEAEHHIREAQDRKAAMLHLTNLNLVSLPNMIGTISTLEALGLSWNQLTTLPESLGNCTALRTLGFAKNQLTTLPDSLGNCTALNVLWCAENPWDEAWLRSQGLMPGEDPTIDSLKKLQTGRLVKAARTFFPDSSCRSQIA
jgi:hypothetical protein